MPEAPLGGKRIVVVGGSSGIGLATAQLLRQEGAEVIIASRSEKRLAGAAAELGGNIRTEQVDIVDLMSVQRLFARIDSLDHLVVTAAGATMGPLLSVDLAKVQAYFDSKFFGAYRVVREAVPRMRPGGSITLFSGAAARRASPGFAYGSAVNAAVEAFSNSLAVELAPLRVNTVSPGIVVTPVWDDLLPPAERDAVFAKTAGTSPVGRVGQPEDVARAVWFLIQSEFVTGAVIAVDGGVVHA